MTTGKSLKALVTSTAFGAVVAAGLMASATSASANVNLGGYTGPVTIKYSNFESLLNPAGTATTTNFQVGDTTFGILTVTSISSNTGSPQVLWTAGAPGDGFLFGVYVGPKIASITPGGGGFQFTSTTTTNINIFSSNTNTFNASQGTGGYIFGGCSLGALCYNGISNVGDPLALSIASAPGISNIAGVLTTGSVNALSSPISGQASFDADATGGTAFSQFHTLGVPNTNGDPKTDFFLSSTFCGNGSSGSCQGGITVGNWLLLSQDPVNGNVVPEPGSLVMIGTALLGFGFMGWRRRAQ